MTTKYVKFMIALVIIATLTVPVMACATPNCNNQQPINVDVNNRIDVDNTFSPKIDVDNFNTNLNLNYNENNNKNYNTNNNVNNNVNNNYNTNNVDVDQKQAQFQNQGQKQSQSQENQQIVNVDIPKGADGGMLISNSNKAPKVAQLDVGEAKTVSRLLYPYEVLALDVSDGDVITIISASDIALYTVGDVNGDINKVNSREAIPTYDSLIHHKFEWGSVVPIDKIDYWTQKATLVASKSATKVVIDNRAPMNSYTHVEITITSKPVTPKATFTDIQSQSGSSSASTVTSTYSGDTLKQ